MPSCDLLIVVFGTGQWWKPHGLSRGPVSTNEGPENSHKYTVLTRLRFGYVALHYHEYIPTDAVLNITPALPPVFILCYYISVWNLGLTCL